ncbi:MULTISPECIES: hypothetical protein [Pseudomonas]|uniref:hypothetical protein n=1 Tax=Pseudomonas TaxID=286 RepID=UPI001BEAD4F0|nr:MULTISPECIES: hypothetical protein [Pseudomonas]MBT2339489.1 hypothetical protein [Pseudomonas fluorescens]MCD4528653.1 hypothetical protein [Pseudomonas sp. C3-2018]
MTATKPGGSRTALQNEFNQLGSRLVRFGQAMQEPSTTVSELTQLAQACGINLMLRMVAESEGRSDG